MIRWLLAELFLWQLLLPEYGCCVLDCHLWVPKSKASEHTGPLLSPFLSLHLLFNFVVVWGGKYRGYAYLRWPQGYWRRVFDRLWWAVWARNARAKCPSPALSYGPLWPQAMTNVRYVRKPYVYQWFSNIQWSTVCTMLFYTKYACHPWRFKISCHSELLWRMRLETRQGFQVGNRTKKQRKKPQWPCNHVLRSLKGKLIPSCAKQHHNSSAIDLFKTCQGDWDNQNHKLSTDVINMLFEPASRKAIWL